MHDPDAIDVLTAQVNELAQVCARLSEENAELRSQVLASPSRPHITDESTWPIAAEPRGLNRLGERRINRRTIGVVLAGLAAGVAGSAVLTDRSAHPAVSASEATPDRAEKSAQAELAAFDEPAPVVPVGPGSIVSGTRATVSGVLSGTNTSTGPGVRGANTGIGPGITGSSKAGRGGVFTGSAAQIRLAPGAGSHPRSGEIGDLYADSSGRLWFCAAGGTTATWRRIV